MTLLERYIFRRALLSSTGALVSLALIVWIVQALSRIDIVKTSASAAGNILWIALMLLPDLAAGVVPFAVLIGAIQTLNALNADSERAVIAASGASMRYVVRPILALGFLGGFLMLLVAHVIGPAASSAFYNGIRSINVDTITVFLTPGRFERVQDDLVISVENSSGSRIQGLFIHDTRDPLLDLTYFAREAGIVKNDEQSVLMLYDGQLHRKQKNSKSVSVIEFQTYAFDLADLKPADEGTWIRTSEQSTWALLNPDVDDTTYQRNPARYVEELADRFSSWLFSVVFALWAIVVAGQPQTNRQASNAAMTLGLTGAIGLKATGFLALSAIGDNASLAFLAIAIPLAAMIFDTLMIRSGTDITKWRAIQALGEVPGAIVNAVTRRRRSQGRYHAGGAGR